jgi:hypothetical protein
MGMIEVMEKLGDQRFFLAGNDRCAWAWTWRTGYTLSL